ncbi:MAG TPA: restriction endonuclease [Verrucomicrobiae bacterium]
MARRRKGSDPLVAILQAIATAALLGVIYIRFLNPALGETLLRVVPWVAIALLLSALAWYFLRALLSRTFLQITNGPDRIPTISAIPTSIPLREVNADSERERLLTLEEKLDRIDWFQFEKIVELLYSSRGCKVNRRGGANPDGGIDLIVNSGTEQFAVQCKYWKAYQVGVPKVREFLGALQDAKLTRGVIISIKGFSEPARELAARHNIELLDKADILQMLNEARFTPYIREINALLDTDGKRCPKCEREMVLRTSSRDGSKFWGCSVYPRCRYTMNQPV